jgi:hypothetical protein
MFEGDAIKNQVEVKDPDGGTLPVPVQPVHLYLVPSDSPAGLVANAVTLVPESYQWSPTPGFGESCADATISLYWAIQFQIMVEGDVIKNQVEVEEPEPGTLPVPVQPVHLYLVPPDSSAGLATEAVTFVPESYQ